MIIIGPRSSESTFGANNWPPQVLENKFKQLFLRIEPAVQTCSHLLPKHFWTMEVFALSSELDISDMSHLYIPPSSMRALFSMSSCSNCLLSTWIRFFQSKGFNPERTPRSWPERPLGVHWKSRNCALWGKNSVLKRASWNGWLISCFPRLVPLFCSQWKRIDDIVNMIDPTFDPCLTCIARKKISWGGVDYLCREPPGHKNKI